MAKKITPEIEKFIKLNRALSGSTLKDLIAKKFKIVVTSRSVELYLAKARAEAESDNSAKVEAVREKILDDADKWANKYLQYLDDETESLRKLIEDAEKGTNPIKLETAKDRLAASAALHKMLSTIIEFVKPQNSIPVNDADSNAKLDVLIARRNARRNIKDN
jgi:hypothetical protein